MGQYKEGEKVGSAQELANRIFTTVYMGTVNSGSATKDRARNLAGQIGADHLDVKVDLVIDAMAKLFEMITGRTPRFRVSIQMLVLCAALCRAVLCCAALRWAALGCAVLCCAVLCCAVLCCAVLCCAVLCCAVLCCAVLCISMLPYACCQMRRLN